MQIWCLQSKCVTIIQNFNLLYFIGLDFPFYRFLYCFAVCYEKIFSHRSGALITWIGKVSLKMFLKADIFWSGCTRQIIHAERFFCGCHEVVLNTSVSLYTGSSCFIFLPESSEVCLKIKVLTVPLS